MTTTRFPNGLTTAKKTAPLGEFVLPDPTTAHVYWEDFDRFRAADWIITVVEAGAGSATQALTDGDGGRLLLTNDNAIADRITLALSAENVLFERGKKLWFSTRIKISEIGNNIVIIGLILKSVTNPTGVVTDGVYFQLDGGANNIEFIVIKNSQQIFTTANPTLTANTDFTLSYFYDGKDKITVYFNGGIIFTVATSTTTLPDDEVLGPMMFTENFTAVAHTLEIDYIMVAKER